MFRQVRFNLWVFWHNIRKHNILGETTNLNYPMRQLKVFCHTCNCGRILKYRDGLESFR